VNLVEPTDRTSRAAIDARRSRWGSGGLPQAKSRGGEERAVRLWGGLQRERSEHAKFEERSERQRTSDET